MNLSTARTTLGVFSFLLLFFQLGCSTVPAARQSVAVKELVKTTRSWDGNPLPAYPSGQPEITIRRITVPPGARLETHLHPVINAGVLLRGQLTVVTTEGKTLQMKAGDPIVELVNKAHYGINSGAVPAEILIVYAGSAGTATTVAQEP